MLIPRVKQLTLITAFLMLIASLIAPGAVAAATHAQISELAARLANQVLGAKPGDVVLVTSSPQNMELLEDLSSDLQATGASPIISVSSDRMNQLYFQKVPTKFDTQTQGPLGLAHIITAQINVDYEADPAIFGQVPPQRLNALTKGGIDVGKYMMAHKEPYVEVGNGLYPSKYTAQQYNVSVGQLSDLFWNGVNADPATIRANGSAIQSALGPGTSVHITAPNGTDVTFKAAAASVIINDGMISNAARKKGGAALNIALPAGDVTFIPMPSSANGTVVFGTNYVLATKVSNLALRVVNGKVTSWKASSGHDAFAKFYTAGPSGKEDFSFADIGANSKIHLPPSGTLSAASMAGGMVTLGIGNNVFAGGTNSSTLFFSTWVPNATVKIGTKTVVKNGSLTL